MLGKIVHRLSGLLPIRFHHILICSRSVQHANDGGKHWKGVVAEVGGKEVLRRSQTGGIRLKVVCVRWHLDKGIDRLAFPFSRRDR